MSFDVDDDSVACTTELRSRFATSTSDWRIEQGSLLDADYLRSLGPFDVVYCWGVAHHTGAMWTALENLSRIVAPHGLLVIAIYNDQEYLSKAWTMVKSVYQRLPRFLRPPYVAAIGLYGFLQRFATTLMACCLRLVTFRNPLVPIINWLRQPQQRGMHVWYDLVDWVGGWPYEVAKPEALFRFFRDRGFELREMTTCSGHGCNEFVFCRKSP